MPTDAEFFINLAAALIALLAVVFVIERVLLMFNKPSLIDAEKLKVLTNLAFTAVEAVRQVYGKPGEKMTAEELLNQARVELIGMAKAALPDVSESVLLPLLETYIEAAVAELKKGE